LVWRYSITHILVHYHILILGPSFPSCHFQCDRLCQPQDWEIFCQISMETASLGGLAGFQYISPNHIIKSPVHWQNGKSRPSQLGKTVQWIKRIVQLLPWKSARNKFINWKTKNKNFFKGPTKLVLAVALPLSVWRDQSGLWIWRMSLINW